jgi:hypothetical protein
MLTTKIYLLMKKLEGVDMLTAKIGRLKMVDA